MLNLTEKGEKSSIVTVIRVKGIYRSRTYLVPEFASLIDEKVLINDNNFQNIQMHQGFLGNLLKQQFVHFSFRRNRMWKWGRMLFSLGR